MKPNIESCFSADRLPLHLLTTGHTESLPWLRPSLERMQQLLPELDRMEGAVFGAREIKYLTLPSIPGALILFRLGLDNPVAIAPMAWLPSEESRGLWIYSCDYVARAYGG